MPYFFISLGPTSVGKTTSFKRQIKKLNLSNEYLDINIDNCVVKNKDYINFVDKMIKDNPDIIERLREIKIINKLEKKYFQVRSKICDKKFDEEIKDA